MAQPAVRVIPPICQSEGLRRELARHFGLTRRQAQIALFLGDRLTTLEIAAELTLSRHTVRRHVESILPKLGVNNRQAVRACIAGLQPNAGEV